MNKRKTKVSSDAMYEAILTLESVSECRKFMQDLCTVSELQAMEQRFQVATLLHRGMIYQDILARTGASSATISRVNRSLQHGADGYEIVFQRLGVTEGSAAGRDPVLRGAVQRGAVAGGTVTGGASAGHAAADSASARAAAGKDAAESAPAQDLTKGGGT